MDIFINPFLLLICYFSCSKDWLFRQICNATPPLHPLLPPLIEVFVTSVVMPTQSGSKHLRNAPLSEREILSVFKSSAVSFVSGSEAMEVDEKVEIGEEERMTAQLLMLYYVLLYEDCVLNNMKHLSECETLPASGQYIIYMHVIVN